MSKCSSLPTLCRRLAYRNHFVAQLIGLTAPRHNSLTLEFSDGSRRYYLTIAGDEVSANMRNTLRAWLDQ